MCKEQSLHNVKIPGDRSPQRDAMRLKTDQIWRKERARLDFMFRLLGRRIQL